jgi:hypothetical protein
MPFWSLVFLAIFGSISTIAVWLRGSGIKQLRPLFLAVWLPLALVFLSLGLIFVFGDTTGSPVNW